MVADRPNYDVALIGRANVDITMQIPRLPQPGRTTFAVDSTVLPGGKSLNQAAAIARLGGRCALIAGTGDDQWGDLLRTALKDFGVDVGHLVRSSATSTSFAVVQVTPDGENFITLGINPATELDSNTVDQALDALAFDTLVLQLDLNPAVTLTALSKSRGRLLVGNLVPHVDFPRGDLARLDVLVTNIHEATAILGTNPTSAMAAARGLLDLGPRAAVVTAGAAGAAYCSPSSAETIPAQIVQALNTTGAGDAFLGALVLALSRRSTLPTAVRTAVAVGTAKVQHHGGQLPAVDPVLRR